MWHSLIAMRPAGIRSVSRRLGCALVLSGLLAAGCTHKEEAVIVRTAVPEPMVFAVGPVLNFSGDFSVDPVKVADLLASELTFVDGATVLPVSRVVAVLMAQGKSQIESPAHALQIADAVGADGIIVAGITEYDAYTPTMGLAMQLYETAAATPRRNDSPSVTHPIRPVSMADFAASQAPTAQVQVIYNGNHRHVADLIKAYAATRDEGLQMGWRQYLKVQTLFVRFCWHDAISRLLSRFPFRDAAVANVGSMENPS